MTEPALDQVCIFGAGAVGGHLAARLAASGRIRVSVVARGPMLRAIRERGLTVLYDDGSQLQGRPDQVTDDASELPPQRLVVVTLKAWQAPRSAQTIARLLAPDGIAVFALNGIPWWWRYGGSESPGPLPLVDPAGALWSTIGPERALGAVIRSPNEVIEPGVIRHHGANRFIIGEPNGQDSARLKHVVASLVRGDVDAVATTQLRRETLSKLVLNVSGNVLTALTRRDLYQVGADPALRTLSMALMREAVSVSAALGFDLSGEIDLETISGRAPPGTRPSMLQDVIAGRPIESEAIMGQLHAFATERSIPVPTMDLMLPLLRGLNVSLREAIGAGG
jgi:2-dehydropantoate 2-reductase